MREPYRMIHRNFLHASMTGLPPDHVVGWRDGTAITHAELQHEINRWHVTLHGMPGHRFALYFNDSLHFAGALFGAWRAGKTILLPSDVLEGTCQSLQHDVDGFIGDFAPKWEPHQAIQTSTPSLPWSDPEPDFVALQVYTSGSTGQAQAIPKQLAQLANEVATLERLFGAQLGNADIVSTVSHQHIYGLLFKVLWPIAAGRAIHASSAFFTEDLKRLAPPHPWCLVSSPAHLKRFPDNPTLPDTGKLQAVFSSGGPLAADTAQQIHTLFGHRPIEIYGSSETGGIAWRQPASPDQDDRWHPLPGVDVRPSAQGTLEVSSPHLPDSAWFTTADRIDTGSDQSFYLRGRADRIVKLEEKRISLDQIERLLVASGLLSEAKVLLHQGKGQRQFIAAFGVPTSTGRACLTQDGKPALNAALRRVLATDIEGIALPRLWRYLDAMPTNAQGKVTVAALQALLEKPLTVRPTLPDITVTSLNETQVVLSLHIRKDLLYFDGHFPETPILPGVVQTDWALTLGRRYFSLPPAFHGIQALKFQRVITPETTVEMELQYDTSKQSLAFRLHSPAGQHASGRIMLRERA